MYNYAAGNFLLVTLQSIWHIDLFFHKYLSNGNWKEGLRNANIADITDFGNIIVNKAKLRGNVLIFNQQGIMKIYVEILK